MNRILVLLVAAAAMLAVPNAARGELILWAAPATTCVKPDDASIRADHIAISAARNEWEPFQVVVSALGEPLSGVTVEASDLRAERERIGRENIHLFREHYIEVTRSSYRRDVPPGWWPDALIPFENPLGGPFGEAKYRAQPFDVQTGRNQPIWCEVWVPWQARSGRYTSTISAKAAGGQRAEVEVSLTVYDFQLPAVASVRSDFGSVARAAPQHGLEASDPAWLPIEERYHKAMIAHRIMPAAPDRCQPTALPDGSIDTTQSHPILKHYIEELGLNSLRLRRSTPYKDPLGADRATAIKYLRNLYGYLEANGWADMAYIYVRDEPNDAEAYEYVRQWAALIHEATPKLQVLCTEQTITSNAEWGDLYGAVDIWVPLWALYDEQTAAERLAKGEKLWGYTALCQGKQPSPWWQLDFPVLNYRIPLWINWRYGMTGLLYWTTTHWQQTPDPWTDPLTHGRDRPSGYNAEGSLFYPGSQAGFDGPVASIRLKMIREGMEDYEYFRKLVERGGKELADSEVQAIARSWFDWDADPAHLMAARERIARAIEGKA
jgi:hypothetical protein